MHKILKEQFSPKEQTTELDKFGVMFAKGKHKCVGRKVGRKPTELKAVLLRR